MTSEDARKFDRWVESLRDRVRRAKLDPPLAAEILGELNSKHKKEIILGKVNAMVHDEILKSDLVRTLVVLEGTLRVTRVAANGRPLECE